MCVCGWDVAFLCTFQIFLEKDPQLKRSAYAESKPPQSPQSPLPFLKFLMRTGADRRVEAGDLLGPFLEGLVAVLPCCLASYVQHAVDLCVEGNRMCGTNACRMGG